MKKSVIPIAIKYWQDDWIQENEMGVLIKEPKVDKKYVTKTIDEYLKKANSNDIIEVNFSGIDTEQKEDLLNAAFDYVLTGRISEIKITTRPSCINKKFLKMLKKYKIKKIELEVASTNDYILKRLGVDYTYEDIKKAAKLIRWNWFKLGFQVFVGVPESTKIDDVNTIKSLIKLKPKSISLAPTLVFKDTPLEKEYEKENYKPLTLVQAVETCKEIVKVLNDKKIETIAIGYGLLDNDIEQLELAEKVKDGPFHPSFRQLVESRLWYDAVVNKIKKLNVKVSQVEVTVNPIDVNNVVGFKQENILNLKETYDVDLIIESDENIKQGKSKIEVTNKY